MRIIEWFRPFPKTFFSGLGKIENKRLEQKQIYDQKQFFFKDFFKHCFIAVQLIECIL